MPILNKVMLAEDEPDLQEITKEALSSLGGFEVFCCDSGVEVIEHFEEQKPDMLLLDVIMPNLDGMETLKKLNEKFTLNIPVVYLTAETQKKDVDHLKSLGASEVLSKPVDFMTIADFLREIFSRYHSN